MNRLRSWRGRRTFISIPISTCFFRGMLAASAEAKHETHPRGRRAAAACFRVLQPHAPAGHAATSGGATLAAVPVTAGRCVHRRARPLRKSDLAFPRRQQIVERRVDVSAAVKPARLARSSIRPTRRWRSGGAGATGGSAGRTRLRQGRVERYRGLVAKNFASAAACWMPETAFRSAAARRRAGRADRCGPAIGQPTTLVADQVG